MALTQSGRHPDVASFSQGALRIYRSQISGRRVSSRALLEAYFTVMEQMVAARSLLKRNVNAHDVGKAAGYLLDAEDVTGTVAYVDAGNHAMGL